MVPLDGEARRTGDAGRSGGRNQARSRKIQEHLPSLDGEYQGLVHLAPALVGPAHSGLVSAPRRLRSGPQRRRGTGESPGQERRRLADARRSAAGRGRARHLVLVVAVAHLGIRRHPPPE